MIKLIRSTLGDYSTIHDPKLGKIQWKYFEKLVAYREKSNLITHKLNKHHILYWKNRMNVRHAVQVFSNGAATSMDYLREIGDRGFQDSRATSYLASNMNKLFEFFRKMIKYLKSLRLKGILCSRRRTGFVGFIINMMSAMQMYEEYVVPGHLSHLALFYNSQDMLESFFR